MSQSAYKKAGVDIDAGNELVKRIGPAVKATQRSGCMGGLGGFGALFDLKGAGYDDPVLVSATDGVGTKLKIAIETGRHDTIGQDLVAMCVNDLVVQGAEPLFFLDYFACSALDVAHAESVIKGIAKGCEMACCALIGGETAEMPGMYAKGEYDLAGFAVGAAERGQLIDGSNLREGDFMIGLPSSGVHSNGFSLVRQIIADQGLTFDSELPFTPDFADDHVLADALLRPTRIYTAPLVALMKQHPHVLKAMAHITGGGLLENIPRVLPDDLAAELDAGKWIIHNIFKWMERSFKLSHEDMALTFNCGLGMVLFCAADDAPTVMQDLQRAGEYPAVIGQLVKSSDLSTHCEIKRPQIGIMAAGENWE